MIREEAFCDIGIQDREVGDGQESFAGGERMIIRESGVFDQRGGGYPRRAGADQEQVVRGESGRLLVRRLMVVLATTITLGVKLVRARLETRTTDAGGVAGVTVSSGAKVKQGVTYDLGNSTNAVEGAIDIDAIVKRASSSAASAAGDPALLQRRLMEMQVLVSEIAKNHPERELWLSTLLLLRLGESRCTSCSCSS